MASNDDYLEGFSLEATRKPISGVTDVEIPKVLADALAIAAPKALEDPDFEITLNAKDEASAQRLAGYAKAWGARQVPKLRITKIPNRKGMPDNVARLDVKLDSEVSQDNRPGRRAK